MSIMSSKFTVSETRETFSSLCPSIACLGNPVTSGARFSHNGRCLIGED